jgi:hypothetical protein
MNCCCIFYKYKILFRLLYIVINILFLYFIHFMFVYLIFFCIQIFSYFVAYITRMSYKQYKTLKITVFKCSTFISLRVNSDWFHHHNTRLKWVFCRLNFFQIQIAIKCLRSNNLIVIVLQHTIANGLLCFVLINSQWQPFTMQVRWPNLVDFKTIPEWYWISKSFFFQFHLTILHNPFVIVLLSVIADK